MEKNGYMVRCETYDEERIQGLCQSDEVRGIIVGDLFCQKRMFENGIVDLILLIKKIMLTDKELAYQAPLYVTSRNLDEVVSILRLISGHSRNTYAIVQDFGTAEVIRRDFPRIKLIWGQMGRVREHRFSDDFLNFLKLKNFYGMETCQPEFAKRLTRFQLVPFWGNARLTYETIGRNCYLTYQTGSCDSKACLGGNYALRMEDGSFSMTIDGYMLGKKLVYLKEETFSELCNHQEVIPVRYLESGMEL